MKINNIIILEEMKKLIFHDGDVRPVWIGNNDAETDTDIIIHKPYAKWAREHFSLYKGFFNSINNEKELKIKLINSLQKRSFTVLEILTDSISSLQLRKKYWAEVVKKIERDFSFK